MSHSITARLNQDATFEKTGKYTFANFRFGVKFWDHALKQQAWTNYKVSVFVKDTQREYLEKSLVKNCLVKVTSKKQKACIGQGQDGGHYAYIEMLESHIDGVWKLENNAVPEIKPDNAS